MQLQQDSLTVEQQESALSAVDTALHIPARPQTPYQVLRMLPKDATPAQQDSAIQAWLQPVEIRYSSRPDTLHLPGHGVGRNLKEVNLPQYYRETYFANDTLLHPEVNGGRYGMAGDPVPYTVRNDNLITSILLVCLVLMLVIYSHSRRFIARQYKELIYVPHAESTQTETTGERRIKLLMTLQTCLLFSIVLYFCTKEYVADTFILASDYHLVVIFFGMLLGYVLGKVLLYTLANSIFFDGKKNGQFIRSFLLITATQGVLLFPVVLLLVYFDLSMRYVVYYFAGVVFIGKILVFYKTYIIFFRQNAFFLQIILYLCALEIVPLVSLIGTWRLVVDYLKVNF